MSNGEKVDRNWLVYSLSADCVYCFPSKLFNLESNSKSNIVNIGFNDWKHLPETLESHEVSKLHYQCVTNGMNLRNVHLHQKKLTNYNYRFLKRKNNTGEQF